MARHSLFGWSLRRLALVALVVTGVYLLLTVGLVRQLDRANFRDRLRADTIVARDLVQRELAAAGVTTPDYQQVCRDLAGLIQARVILLDADRSILGDSAANAQRSPVISGQAVDEAMAGRFGYELAGDGPDGGLLRLHQAAAPLKLGDRVTAVVQLSRVETLPDRGWGYWFRVAMPPVLLLLLCSLLIAWGAHRRTRDSVGQVTDRIDRFAQGDFSLRSATADVTELDGVVESFNRLAEAQETLVRGLQLEKRQWEALFTGMREGIVAVDGVFNMIAMNQAARLFLGLPDDEDVTGRPLFTAVRNANLNHFIHELFKSEDAQREAELEIRSPSGAITTYRLSGVRFEYEPGKVPGALVVLHDITRVRRLENMRKEFVANVSHELKTPITSIKGFVETLQSCLPDEPDHAARFATIIQEQADRLNAIIDDLLTLSRLEQADHWVAKDFQTGTVLDTVNGAVKLCDARIRQRGVTVSIDIPDISLYANHRLLEQAISNLVDNAVKYSPEGAPVAITASEDARHITLSVRDHGIGIPAEHLERIFERFHRVDKSRDRQTGGTGLGLSIVKHIVRVHGGTVSVESTPGQGATFTIRLPRRQNSPAR